MITTIVTLTTLWFLLTMAAQGEEEDKGDEPIFVYCLVIIALVAVLSVVFIHMG